MDALKANIPCYMTVTGKKITKLLPVVITLNVDTGEIEKSNCVMFSNN